METLKIEEKRLHEIAQVIKVTNPDIYVAQIIEALFNIRADDEEGFDEWVHSEDLGEVATLVINHCDNIETVNVQHYPELPLGMPVVRDRENGVWIKGVVDTIPKEMLIAMVDVDYRSWGVPGIEAYNELKEGWRRMHKKGLVPLSFDDMMAKEGK